MIDKSQRGKDEKISQTPQGKTCKTKKVFPKGKRINFKENSKLM